MSHTGNSHYYDTLLSCLSCATTPHPPRFSESSWYINQQNKNKSKLYEIWKFSENEKLGYIFKSIIFSHNYKKNKIILKSLSTWKRGNIFHSLKWCNFVQMKPFSISRGVFISDWVYSLKTSLKQQIPDS